MTPGVNPDAAFGIPPDTFWMSGHDGQSICIIQVAPVGHRALGVDALCRGYTSQPLVKAVLEALK